MLGGHFLLLLPAHLLLMMQRTHLLLVMLSGHLLLMMLSIHLLLMIHRVLPLSHAFMLDSFVVGAGLVSLNVVIVAVKIFSLVFVPVILGPKLLGMFFTARSRVVLSFSRSRSCCPPCGLESLRAFALASAFVFVERLDRFLVRFPLARRSEEIFVFGCRLLTCQLL